MTLGNMRENGVRSLDSLLRNQWCGFRRYNKISLRSNIAKLHSVAAAASAVRSFPSSRAISPNSSPGGRVASTSICPSLRWVTKPVELAITSDLLEFKQNLKTRPQRMAIATFGKGSRTAEISCATINSAF